MFVFLTYLKKNIDGGSLIQPFTNLAQHGNSRIKPQIIYKLAGSSNIIFDSYFL
jgi:hypothetical protein